ncbi:hypothetical protein BG011_010135 [Mortierella polycephala]|uniref:Uncharacterized protein n=1 Tax=Mortierella polycephala TaxID=41804 RepID=A0A9P6TVM7_9FUNG|nr:hypothetical protein BG011_010135 [Mortierella polycephala]
MKIAVCIAALAAVASTAHAGVCFGYTTNNGAVVNSAADCLSKLFSYLDANGYHLHYTTEGWAGSNGCNCEWVPENNPSRANLNAAFKDAQSSCMSYPFRQSGWGGAPGSSGSFNYWYQGAH